MILRPPAILILAENLYFRIRCDWYCISFFQLLQMGSARLPQTMVGVKPERAWFFKRFVCYKNLLVVIAN